MSQILKFRLYQGSLKYIELLLVIGTKNSIVRNLPQKIVA